MRRASVRASRAVAWRSAAQVRAEFDNPRIAGAAVAGWRQAEPLADPHGIVGYEVAGTAERAGAILEQWASSAVTDTARLMMAIDLAYPLVYGYALLLGLHWAAARSGRTTWLPRLRWLALGAPAADYVENVCLIWQLWAMRASALSAGLAAGAAYLKFALIVAALVAIARLSRRRGARDGS